jgi:hypothetical protein
VDDKARVTRAKERYSARLLREPEVSSVGVKRTPNGEYALVIGLTKKPSSIKAALRRKLEIPGVPVVLETVGTFRKL